MKTALSLRRSGAFSLVEVITIVAVLGILAAVAIPMASGLIDRVRLTKMESDVATLNHAVKVYLANGGSFASGTQAAEVLRKLKTVRSEEAASRYVGFSGAMVDARITPVWQTEAESAAGRARVLWNEARSAFEIRYAGAGGIASFAVAPAEGARNFGEEERSTGALDFNAENGWIWAYRDAPAAAPAAATQIPVGAPASGGLPGPQAAPRRLASPQFTTAPGTYDYPSFPSMVSISNPNPDGSSTLFVATAWDGTGIQWTPYTGPVAVLPGTQILTYARTSSAGFLDSYTVGGVYVRNSFSLVAPEIVLSAPVLDLQSNAAVTLELVDTNPDFAQHRLEFSINGGDYAVYAGPASLTPAQYATGFSVAARSVPTAEGFRESPQVSASLNLKLRTPLIEVGESTGGTASVIPVTLSHSNPEGSSEIRYALRDEATGTATSFQPYRGVFQVAERDYPEGFTVVAYAEPLAAQYVASDEVSSFRLTFFGIPVTGSTIFVLDHSGSMAWEDGIGQVKAEMNRVLDLLKAEDRFGVIKFSSEASVVMNWTSGKASNVKTAKSRVNALTASGMTNYSDALALALQMARKNDVKQVVFLSDGAPTAGNTSSTYILSQVRQIVAEGTRVDTLAFGLITPDGRELLAQMAAIGNLPR